MTDIGHLQTDIVIYRNKLMEEAEIRTVENGFNYSLKGYDGMGSQGGVIWGDEKVFHQEPITVDINLPDGYWILAASPVSGWNQFNIQDNVLSIIFIISSLVISILIWLYSHASIKIRTSNKELQAIFESTDTSLIEFNRKGECVKVVSSKEGSLPILANVLPGKSVKDIFDERTAGLIQDSILECSETGKPGSYRVSI